MHQQAQGFNCTRQTQAKKQLLEQVQISITVSNILAPSKNQQILIKPHALIRKHSYYLYTPSVNCPVHCVEKMQHSLIEKRTKNNLITINKRNMKKRIKLNV